MKHSLHHPATLAVGCWLAALPALAHPGHELTRHGPLHLITSPHHLAVLGGTGIILCLGGRWITHQAGRRWFRALGTAAVCAAGGLWILGT